MTGALRPLNDSALISLLRRRAEGLLDAAGTFRLDAIRERRWVVVPMESALHFDHDDATRLATAIRRMSAEVYAVGVEGLHHVDAYRVRVSREGLMNFSAECGLFTYLLIPIEDDGHFAILCSVADYYLVAGPSEFVEEASGADIATAFDLFEEFATDRALPLEKQASLKRLVSMYRTSASTTLESEA